ncbi:hypothetical protein H9P43_006921 [Blastocladiella emersonii ATCC 22665]|nr:hypothetical protein H9P43_006921 [Blastocladiella emersonii ATCC 22665]
MIGWMNLVLAAVLALAPLLAAGFSGSLSFCETTEQDMVSDMGGRGSSALGFALQTTNATSNGTLTTIALLATDPASQLLRGLLLWATDADAKRVGTWKLRDGSAGYTLVDACSGGAVSHTSSAAKSFAAGAATKPDGFVLTVPAGAKAPVVPTSTTALSAVFLLQGVGMLFPWNALISAPDFFRAKLDGSRFAHSFENWFSVTFLVVNLATMAVALAPVSPRTDRMLAVGSFAVNAGVFVLLLAIAVGFLGVNPELVFGVVLAGVAASGSATALVQTHLFAVASRVKGAAYTSMLLVGQAVSGVTICLVQLALQLAHVEPKPAAVFYFSSAIVVVLACLLLYLPLGKAVAATEMPDSDDEGDDDDDDASSLATSSITEHHTLLTGTDLVTRRLALFRAAQPYVWAVVLDFTVSLALFPGFTSLLRATSGTQSTFTAAAFLVFNLGDTLGRVLPSLLSRISPVFGEGGAAFNSRTLIAASLARFAFLPAFLLLPLIDSVRKNPLVPTWTGAPPAVVLLMIGALAATSGMVPTLALAGAANVEVAGRAISAADRGVVGRIMTFAMLLGLAAGAGFGFVVVGAATV